MFAAQTIALEEALQICIRGSLPQAQPRVRKNSLGFTSSFTPS